MKRLFDTRLFDVFASVAGLLITAPLCLLIALAIILESGTPVLFCQLRVGRDARLFRIFKFRTMRTGLTGTSITVAGDARITRCGAFLRASKLDELPQLWNVLRGEMAIIGPRPELPAFVSQFAKQYTLLLKVRPGMVDAASIAFHDEPEQLAIHANPGKAYVHDILPRKLALSTHYLSTRSWSTDLTIIIRALVLGFKSFFR